MSFLKNKLILACFLSLCMTAFNAPVASAQDMDRESMTEDFLGEMDQVPEDDSDESFCRYMCPQGDPACTYEDCMKTAKESGIAPKGAAPAAGAAMPAQPQGQMVNRPLVVPNPACKGAQSSCCLLDNSCIPGCPVTRELCIRK